MLLKVSKEEFEKHGRLWHQLVLEDLASEANLRVVEVHKGRYGIHFRLRTKGSHAAWRRFSVRRNLDGTYEVRDPVRIIPGAVCWHGHREFMRLLFSRFPDAVLHTALTDYRGMKDFEENHEQTYYRIRPMMRGSVLPENQYCVCLKVAEDLEGKGAGVIL